MMLSSRSAGGDACEPPEQPLQRREIVHRGKMHGGGLLGFSCGAWRGLLAWKPTQITHATHKGRESLVTTTSRS
jgi:hypothetical protein